MCGRVLSPLPIKQMLVTFFSNFWLLGVETDKFVLGEKRTQAGRRGGKERCTHSQKIWVLSSLLLLLSMSFLFTLEALSCDLS